MIVHWVGPFYFYANEPKANISNYQNLKDAVLIFFLLAIGLYHILCFNS